MNSSFCARLLQPGRPSICILPYATELSYLLISVAFYSVLMRFDELESYSNLCKFMVDFSSFFKF